MSALSLARDALPQPASLAATWRASGLLAPGQRVLVAVSGGADSVALAALLAAAAGAGLPLELTLAHLDHGWRGAQEARQDREVVEALAARLGIALLLAGPPDPPALGEERARRWRYATLARLARERGILSVAVGHHLRDQAETVLMRLLRGSGQHGLSGMQARRALDGGALALVRPLLTLHPEALRRWNLSQGLAWREDPTNLLPSERSTLRRRLEALERRAGNPAQRLADLAHRLGARLERRMQQVSHSVTEALETPVPGDVVTLPRTLLAGLHGETLAFALRRLGGALGADRDGPWFTRRHLAQIEVLLAATGALDLPRGLALRVSPSRVWLLRRARLGPSVLRLVVERLPRTAFDLEAFVARGDPLSAAVDADVLGTSPRLRRLAPGDAFVPLGKASDAPQPLDAWLAKRSVPAPVRAAVLLVEGRCGVAWVIGQRIDQRHAVGATTRTVACLSVRAPGEAAPGQVAAP